MENAVLKLSISSDDEDSQMNSTYGNQVVESVFEHFYQRQIVAGLVCLIAIAGTVGNTGVIVAFILSKKLQTTTNFFVVNLAVADLLNCLFMPWQAVAQLSVHGWFLVVDAQWLCVTSAFVGTLSLGCSTNSLALIAVNRWVVITKSRRTVCWLYTPRKLAGMVGISWAIPLPIVLFALLNGVLGYNKYFSNCTRHDTNGLTINIIRAAVFYLVPLCVVVVCYTSVFCYLRKITRKITEAPTISGKVTGRRGANRTMQKYVRKRQFQVTKKLLNLVLAFVICVTPYFFTVNIRTAFTQWFRPWAGVLLLFNSCVNPVIYAVLHPDFKKVMKKMIRCQKIQRNSLQLRYT